MYEDINEMIWVTKGGEMLRLGDMSREHVRNCLQFCTRKYSELGAWEKELGIPVTKDGYRYPEWCAAFTAKLLDPNLSE